LPRKREDVKGMATVDLSQRGGQYVGSWRVFLPDIDYSNCTGCMLCAMYCPEAAIRANEEGKPEVDLNFCKGCGVCANECPKKGIKMKKEE
jgi:pyruvate ferredoxin oxidoreductase delta subunit